MRVVSLFPAATEIVAAVGGPAMLVGVSHACDWPPAVRSLPRVTRAADAPRRSSTFMVDVDLLRRLAPDLVIGQTVCDVCAVGEVDALRALAKLDPHPPLVTLHAHTLDGVFADIEHVGVALGLADEAEELVDGLRYRLSVVRNHAPRTTPRRVLVLEWLDPPFVAAHWVPELVAIAGGTDVGAKPGERSRARPWAELQALAPDVVVIALCGYDVARARQDVARVHDPVGRRLLERGVWLDGNAYTSRPGPRLVDGAERLAALISG